jgi:hypothetical protein
MKRFRAKGMADAYDFIRQPSPAPGVKKRWARARIAGAVVLAVVVLDGVGALLLLTGHNREPAPPVPTPVPVRNPAPPRAPNPGLSAAPLPNPSPSHDPNPSPPPPPKPQRALPPVTFARYGNPRFAFFTDYPTFMKAEPEPANGDGQCWAWESYARMCASGIHNWPPGVLGEHQRTAKETCDEEESGLTYRHLSGNTCVKSGLRDGKVFWTRYTYAHDIAFDIDLLYDEDLTQAFNPIVERLNARLNVDAESWVEGAPP